MNDSFVSNDSTLDYGATVLTPEHVSNANRMRCEEGSERSPGSARGWKLIGTPVGRDAYTE